MFLQQESVSVIIPEDACEVGPQFFQDPKRERRGKIPCVNHMMHVPGIEVINRFFQGNHVVVCISDYSNEHGLPVLPERSSIAIFVHILAY
jgi:hypothetical protein